MRRLILCGVLALSAVVSSNVLKLDKTNGGPYFTESRLGGVVPALSANAEKPDFHFIQKRWSELQHNVVKRSPGWKSKGSSKSGSKGGFFSSSSKAKGNNKGHDYNNGGGSQHGSHSGHSSYPQQPAHNPNYGHPPSQHGYGQPPSQPGYGQAPSYNPAYGHPPASGYGQPAYHAPAPQPAYHAPAPQPQVVVLQGGGGGAPMKGPGLGSAIATGLAQGAGSGVGFGLANAAINGITGGGSRHSYSEPRPAPASNSNNDNSGNNNNNNNNNFNSKGDYNTQANPECLKTCYSTEEYAPVCGTDGWEYTNIGKLNCMKTCGKNVEVARYGNCYVAPPVQNLPPPPPNSPVNAVSNNSPTLPPGVEAAGGLITGAPVDSTSTWTPPVTTTMSPEYLECFRKCNATSEFNPLCGSDGQDYSNQGRLDCAKGCGKVVDVAYTGVCVTTTSPPMSTPVPN